MRIALYFLLFALSPSLWGQNLMFEQIRKEFDGQQVMILGTASQTSGEGQAQNTKLLEWRGMFGDPEAGFLSGARENAPVAARGQIAQVVRVQEASAGSASGVDVFGKPISLTGDKNPYITIIVRMPDGATYFGATGYYSTLKGRAFQLLSRIEQNRKEIGGYLDSLVGKNIYKLGYTEVYKVDAALDDLLSWNRRQLVRAHDVTNLAPMKVQEARYFEGANAVIFKVSLPSGDLKLLFGEISSYHEKALDSRSRLERMGIRATEKVPAKFTPRELAAIKRAEIFPGMSENALYASWGDPDKTNDWGRGGAQHIFGDKHYVYVQGNRVSDWQSMR
jgi:hypothetical protein